MSGYIQSLMGANEKVIVVERQHWLVWIPTLIVSLIVAAVIVALTIISTTVAAIVGAIGNLGLLLLVLLLVPLIAFLRVFLDWYNEQYIVTNRRIVQSEGIINKSVVDSSLEKINDVVLSQSIMGRILDYGSVEILTGSDIGINKLHRIQSPRKFKRAMLDAKEAMRGYADADEQPQAGKAVKQDVPTMIAELDDLRKKGLITEAEFQEKRAKLMSQI